MHRCASCSIRPLPLSLPKVHKWLILFYLIIRDPKRARDKKREGAREGERGKKRCMYDDLAAHVHPHIHTNTHKSARVDVPWRLVSAHLLCMTGRSCVNVYVDDVTLHRHWARQDFSRSCAVCLWEWGVAAQSSVWTEQRWLMTAHK